MPPTPNDMPQQQPKRTWTPPQPQAAEWTEVTIKDYCAPAQPLPHHHPHHMPKHGRNGYHPMDEN